MLDESVRDRLLPKLVAELGEIEGVDLVSRRANGEAIVSSERGELRFAPGGELEDARGESWSLEGEHQTLALEVADGRVSSRLYPDALGRLWSALDCRTSGDVLVGAEPGYEFVDWGGADHVGGGSHGSLHRGDSLGVLLTCGVDMPEREQWSLRDVTPLVLQHFGLSSS